MTQPYSQPQHTADTLGILGLPAPIQELAQRRWDAIVVGAGHNGLTRYLSDNGMVIIKFFLHLSKDEQKRRFLSRIDEDDKNWKLSASDAKERAFWDDYMDAYEDVFTNTSTKAAPWYIVPADNKWFTRLAVAAIVTETLEKLDLRYPKVSEHQKAQLAEVRRLLVSEKD